MIRADRIKSEMFGGVGWRLTTLSDYPVVTTPNTIASSGRYFQDATSFTTIQNIYDCQQDSNITDENFNTYLTQLQEACISEVCEKIDNKESDFIQSVNLYPYEKTFEDTIEPLGKFVGFQIKKTNRVNALSKVNWIEAAFDSVVTFKIHLYNSNKPSTPIKSKPVTTVANESVIVSLDDWEIADGKDFKGGMFYLGYFEDDLQGAKAIKKDYELSSLKVSTACNYIEPVVLDHSDTTIEINSLQNKSETYGLNIGIDSYNDYTELFVRNKSILYPAIQYQMSEKVFNLMRTSTRSNITQRLTADYLGSIAFELYGDKATGVVGVIGKLERIISDTKKMFFYKPLISRRTLN